MNAAEILAALRAQANAENVAGMRATASARIGRWVFLCR
jgi:hypothetical protein